ncbi:MAG: UbiD family decarboxylase [Planctomycetes bacterium]|nr:UbiD family decarboxylase [Planctomycetota bacterium]
MSLRQFIDSCMGDGDCSVILDFLDVEHEVGSYIRSSCDHDGPMLLTNPNRSHFNGFTIAGGVYGSKRRIKRIFGYDSGIYGSKYVDKPDFEVVKRYAKLAFAPEGFLLNRGLASDAPCQEVVIDQGDVDLGNFPVCTHNEYDSGAFITAGVNVVEWVAGQVQGLGMHRVCIVNRNTISCLAPINRRIGFPHYKKAPIKMAVVIGAPPEVTLASQAKVNQRTNKYHIADHIRGTTVPLTKCVTSKLLVPSEAEIVIECTSIPDSIYDDSPFAEYPGTYSFRSNAWTAHVDCITTRKDWIYQTLLTGKLPQEDSNLCAIPMAAEVYKVAKNLVEEVTDVSAFIGNNVFDTIICVKKNSNEEISNLIWTILGNKYIKSVTVMDEDLKANEEDWRFAFNTRYQPDRDTTITGLGLGASLDPSSPLFQSTSKIALDFTIPVGKTESDTNMNKRRHYKCNAKFKDSESAVWDRIEKSIFRKKL